MPEQTQLSKRVEQIKENFENLSALEDIYCKIGYDYGLISDELIKSLRESQVRKKHIKASQPASMAEFEREYELSEEFIILKSCKYQLRAFERLMSGLKVRIESLKALRDGRG